MVLLVPETWTVYWPGWRVTKMTASLLPLGSGKAPRVAAVARRVASSPEVPQLSFCFKTVLPDRSVTTGSARVPGTP